MSVNISGSGKMLRKQGSKNIAPYLFCMPWFLVFFAFSIFPIGYSFIVSMMNWNGFTEPVFVGAQNYIDIFGDPRFYKALGNTFILMLMIIPVQIIGGLIIALILSNKLMKFRRGFRILIFLPYLTAPIALGIIFGILFDTNLGAVNNLITAMGFQKIDWIGQEWPARVLVSIITIWKYMGYTAVMFMAGITNINPEHYEASEIDGASTIQSMWYIVIPQLRQITTFVVLTTLIGCFQIFEEPFMIFNSVASKIVGGPNNSVLTGMWLFYDTAFSNLMRYGYAAAIAFCLFVVIGIVTIVFNFILKVKGEE